MFSCNGAFCNAAEWLCEHACPFFWADICFHAWTPTLVFHLKLHSMDSAMFIFTSLCHKPQRTVILQEIFAIPLTAVSEWRIAKWEIQICKLSILGCVPRLSGHCRGDKFSLLTGMPICQLHPWHCMFFWQTYGEELLPSPEGNASCFLSFLGRNSSFKLWLYFLLFTRTVVCDTLCFLAEFLKVWKWQQDIGFQVKNSQIQTNFIFLRKKKKILIYCSTDIRCCHPCRIIQIHLLAAKWKT